jgi:hypothetical protein
MSLSAENDATIQIHNEDHGTGCDSRLSARRELVGAPGARAAARGYGVISYEPVGPSAAIKPTRA